VGRCGQRSTRETRIWLHRTVPMHVAVEGFEAAIERAGRYSKRARVTSRGQKASSKYLKAVPRAEGASVVRHVEEARHQLSTQKGRPKWG